MNLITENLKYITGPVNEECYNYLETATCDLAMFCFKNLFYIFAQTVLGFASSPLMVIIHESGHAIAADLLYKNPKHKIILKNYGYGGGECSSNRKYLSKVGRWLGRNNSEAIHYAAGPVVEMGASLLLFWCCPGNVISTQGLRSNAAYANSASSKKAFFTKKLKDLKRGHDFVMVKILWGELAAKILIITSVALGKFAFYAILVQALFYAYQY